MNAISKMKNLLLKGLFVCITILCASCKKDDGVLTITPPIPAVFSFKEEVTTIEVDENVKSFTLEGLFSSNPGLNIDQIIYLPYLAVVDRDKTTAKHNVHFINNINGTFEHSENQNVYQEIELIPENIIGDGVEIVYYSDLTLSSYNPEDFPDNVVPPIPGSENLIYRTIIKLIPKKTEQ